MPDRELFVGVDWATEKHDVCLESPEGKVLGERTFAANGVGLTQMADWIAEHSKSAPETVCVAIELPHGPVVETLIERKFRVHSINPKQLDRFRDRFGVAGACSPHRNFCMHRLGNR